MSNNVARYQDLLIYCQGELPSIEEPYLLHMLKLAARRFCQDSEAWREDRTFYIVDADEAGDTAYDAAIANSMSTTAADQAETDAHDAALKYEIVPNYEAEVLRIFKVWTDGDTDDAPLDPSRYEFDSATNKLRFKSDLQTYSPTATAWATSTAYTTADYIYKEHLGHTHRYLCSIAHTSGTFSTDLAAYKWQAMPDDLIVRIVLLPRLGSVELASWFMERWGEAIVARCKADCMKQPNKRWTNPDMAMYYEREYLRYLNQASREALAGNINGLMQIQSPIWTP